MIKSGSKMTRAALGAALAAVLVGALATAPAAHAATDEAELFCDLPGEELAISPISGLEDGQKVTWLSTVKGTVPTEYTGEYVGKLDNGLGYDASGNPRDLLLVKLEGDVVEGGDGTLPAGVWAGASGSPVYDDSGALIGAVSYGFSWLADNVAGVTPAAYMKTIGDLPGVKQLNATVKRQVDRLVEETPEAQARATMRPLEPVRVTLGASTEDFDEAAARLSEKVDGYTPVRPSGLAIDGGVDDGADYPIIAGGNIAVSYAYGAVGSASVGTVTAVCGDDVYAYGHPNNWNSSFGASIHGASAARIVPDLGGAYKLVSAIGKPKGTLVDDRLAGVHGTLGAPAPTVSLTTVSTLGDHTSTAVTHVSEKSVLPDAAYAQLAVDAERMLDNDWEGAAKVVWSIAYERESGEQGVLKNANRYSSGDGLPYLVGIDVATDIAQLQANAFEDVEVLGVKIKTTFAQGYRAARITGVQLMKKGVWTTVSAGSVTKVTRGKVYSFRAVLSPVPGSERVTEYSPFAVNIPQGVKKNVRMKIGASQPLPGSGDVGYATDFDELVLLLDQNLRSDMIDATRTYASPSGLIHVYQKRLAAPTVVVDEGKIFSFTLQASPKK
ncbi:MAG: hypothetical protein QM602_10090 [Microbacterium sp.]